MPALRMLFVLAVTAGLLVLAPGTSWACSCVQSSPIEQVRRVETVVDGTVAWVSSNGIETTYSVEVDRVFKGKAAEREKLITAANEAACGLGMLTVDKRYLFFIDGVHPGRMRVSLCGGSAPYGDELAAQIEAATGAPTGPVVSPAMKGPVDPDQIQGTPWYTVVGTTLLIAAVLGGLLFYARRSSR